MAVGAEPRNMQPIKKSLDEMEKTIQYLKKKLKIPITDHAQTEKFSILQQERDSLNKEVLNLKEKALQLENDK